MSVLMIVISVIEAFFQALATTIIINKQINIESVKSKINILLLTWIYGMVTFFFIPNQFRFISFVTVIAIILYFVLNKKIRNVVLYVFNTEVLLSLSEILITLILVVIGFDSKKLVVDPMYNLFANFIISLFAVILIQVPIVNKLIKKIIDLFNKKRKLIYYLYLFLLLLYLLTLKNGLELVLKSNYYINILFIVIVIVIIVVIIINELKYDNLIEQNKQMLNYVTKYEKIITDQGKANHEFRNQLLVIRGYAQMKSHEKLLKYLDSIIDDTKKMHNSYLISQLNKFPDGGLKGLLYYKLAQMEDHKIKYQISVDGNVKSNLKKLNSNMYNNITKILGILLDNAIDACKKCNKKEIIIEVSESKSGILFSISNTYSGKVDISKIGSGYTTKGKGHGYGVRIINDIIKENNKLVIDRQLQNKYYISNLIVKNQQKKKK